MVSLTSIAHTQEMLLVYCYYVICRTEEKVEKAVCKIFVFYQELTGKEIHFHKSIPFYHTVLY